MTTLRQAAEEALEALETLPCGDSYKTHNAAILLIKALAEPEQEPEAITYLTQLVEFLKKRSDNGKYMKIPSGLSAGTCYEIAVELEQVINATPPQREWVGLTDEEIDEGQKHSWVAKQAFESAVWWAEERLKEKNNG